MEQLSRNIWFWESNESTERLCCRFEIILSLKTPSEAMDFFASALGGEILQNKITSEIVRDLQYEEEQEMGISHGMATVFFDPFTLWNKSIELRDSLGSMITLDGDWTDDRTDSSKMMLYVITDEQHRVYYKKKILQIAEEWHAVEVRLQNNPENSLWLKAKLHDIAMKIEHGCDLDEDEEKLAEEYSAYL